MKSNPIELLGQPKKIIEKIPRKPLTPWKSMYEDLQRNHQSLEIINRELIDQQMKIQDANNFTKTEIVVAEKIFDAYIRQQNNSKNNRKEAEALLEKMKEMVRK